MVDFKVVVSDRKAGRAYNIEASGAAASAFVGKKIGDKVEGAPLGLAGYSLQITGGSDRTGIAARKDLPGAGRRRILLSKGFGFHPEHEGERRRKTIRGNEITQDFVQINAVVAAYGEKSMDELLGKAEAAQN
ncbi:30S ribosomal protein S6e [Methanofollis tationis]|uniref:Small ribosomal subunit protein eS6 n=2 Tax=Methanofollis TaxID=81416 RepID=A0A7K4HQ63_9EURY|nr:30S ribosomal protein S6e [Methanofollis tationis]NVO67414.1 30S ribosomal protein S6e [Methanofollis tationis]HDS63250.1 30S ribosomal protein S6e [Methanofollis liminatans]